MDFIRIVLTSALSLAILFIIAKIMGFRQISEMSFFDYVIGITIGSIAAELATNIESQWWYGIVAMSVYGIVGFLISFSTQKSIKMRRFISGQPIILIDKGKILRENLNKARIEINDLLTSARGNGYFNLSDIDYAIMETTGKISFQPVALKRPLNPKDFNFAPQREGLYYNLVIDGQIMEKDLKNAKISETELKKQVKNHGAKIEDVILATADENKQLTFYFK
ncbi:MAG: DUF421 domain-containing protein [Eubacterium sp.]